MAKLQKNNKRFIIITKKITKESEGPLKLQKNYKDLSHKIIIN